MEVMMLELLLFSTLVLIGTADYSDLLLILNFNSVDTQFNISVPVVNDAVYEFTEDLTALLAQITSNPNVDVDPDVADLFIEDNNSTYTHRYIVHECN